VLAGVALPQVLAGIDRSRTHAAARFLASRMALARVQAVARGAIVALRFVEDASGVVFRTYVDGNGNGVRTREITSGVDVPIAEPAWLPELFPGVRFALSIGGAPADAIQVGASGILSFTPTGTATSGSVYVRGREGTQFAVRVLGATGRVRVLRYDTERREFVEAF
jgi:hypothetical protein